MDNEVIKQIKSEATAYVLDISNRAHMNAVNGGWWNDIKTGETLIGKRDFIAMCGLIITEITEAYDGWTENAYDDKLPHRLQVEVELGDAMIRMGDTSGGCGIDLAAGCEAIGDSFVPFHHLASFSERCMAAVGYICYSIEGHRKRDYAKRDTNMAKAMFTIMVISGVMNLDVRAAIEEKMAFNKVRPDHKLENRVKDGGKKE